MQLVNRVSLRILLLLLAALLLQSCATSSAIQVARDQFKHGNANDAMQTLAEADVSNRDQLLLYLDRGLVAQALGNYPDSIIAFEQALTLIDELDYLSVRDQTTALISSDWATRYSGEYSERLWVHTFQMLNFLLLNDPISAAVEARRAVNLYKEHGDLLKQDQFTRLLMALSFETAGQFDSAGVEYRKLQQDFDIPLPENRSKAVGELVVFVASGFIAPKLPGDLFLDYDARISFPYYAEEYVPLLDITAKDHEGILPITRADTTLASISSTALSARGKAIAARQALRLAAKHNIADAISSENSVAGDLTKLLLVIIEQADTRSWETLPEQLSLLRIPLTEGQHEITVFIDGQLDQNSLVQAQRTFKVTVNPGEKHFQLIRLGIGS